jgi:hypothetical protein
MSKILVRFGRLGYAVKGVVYIVMGLLALFASFGRGGKTTDTKGALVTIGEAPFGRLALLVIVVGLFGYTAWRLVSAATDAERKGDSPTGLGIRLGAAIRGLMYGALAGWTLFYLKTRRDSGGDRPSSLTDRVLDLPAGRWIVVAAGLGFVGYAVYQVYRALSGKFLDHLSLGAESKETRNSVTAVGKFGITARAVVFGMIGILFVKAGWTYDPAKAGGIQKSLRALSQQPMGEALLKVVALGLMAFGIFQIATARFRVMRAK